MTKLISTDVRDADPAIHLPRERGVDALDPRAHPPRVGPRLPSDLVKAGDSVLPEAQASTVRPPPTMRSHAHAVSPQVAFRGISDAV